MNSHPPSSDGFLDIINDFVDQNIHIHDVANSLPVDHFPPAVDSPANDIDTVVSHEGDVETEAESDVIYTEAENDMKAGAKLLNEFKKLRRDDNTALALAKDNAEKIVNVKTFKRACQKQWYLTAPRITAIARTGDEEILNIITGVFDTFLTI